MELSNRQLTVDEVVPDGGAVTETVVVDVATGTIEVFSDGNQIANGGRSANVREKL